MREKTRQLAREQKELWQREYNDWNHRLNMRVRKIRCSLYSPITNFFDRIGLNADQITNGRLVLALLFIPWFFRDIFAASIFLLIVLWLDTFDGDLARKQNKMSDRGKFLDMLADHSIYAITVMLMLWIGAETELIAFNLLIIPIVYLLGVIKRGEGVPSDWIIKPYPRLSYLRIFPMVAFFFYTILGLDYLNVSLWISNIWATVVAVYYYIMVQLRWRKGV